MFSVKEIKDLIKDEGKWIEMEDIETEKKKSTVIEDELSTQKKEEFENNNISVKEFEEK